MKNVDRYQKNLGSNEQLRNLIRETFLRTGLVHLTNTGSRDPQLLQKPFEDILGTNVIYEGGANPRSHIDGNVYDTGVSMDVGIYQSLTIIINHNDAINPKLMSSKFEELNSTVCHSKFKDRLKFKQVQKIENICRNQI